MNRIFTFLFGLISAVIIFFFVILITALIAEYFQESYMQTPQLDQLYFAMRLSLYTSTIAALFSMLISIPIAYFFTRYEFRGKWFWDSLMDLPIVLSPIAIGAMLLIFFNTETGKQINSLLGPFVFEVKGIILAQVLVTIGLSVRLLKETFSAIDIEYENISRSLGMSQAGTFFKVILPMAKNGILAAFLLVWGRAVGEFGATVTLAGATPLKTETVPVAIYLNFESVNLSNAIVFILVLIVMSLAVLLFVRRLYKKYSFNIN